MTVAGADSVAGPANVKTWLAAMPGWRVHVVAMAVGAVGALAFAPFYVVPAYALALSALVWILDGARRSARPILTGLGRGFSCGLGHFLAGTYWVGAAFTQVDGALALMPFGVLTLAVILAAFWALACGVAIAFWKDDFRRIFVLATTLTAGELLRGHLFGGFPWNLAAYVWEAGGAMSQAAAFVGAYGLTALTILICLTPATLADSERGWAARAAPVMIGALALGVIWGAGAQRLAAAGPAKANGPGPVVRVVDPGLTQREKWEEGREWEVFARYLALSGDPRTSRADIVVWPEGAIPVRYPDMPVLLENPAMQTAIGNRLGDRVLIMGATRVDRDAQGRPEKFYNSSFVIDGVEGRAQIMQRHDKNRLTPGGEFIPLFNLISWLNIPTLQQIGNGFTPGPPPTRLIVPGAEPVLILICYESIFPGLVPRGPDRPGWIANISIDAWYGEGTGPWQNDNQSRYRAIEEGLPMARAASGGVSSIVDPYGRMVVRMDRKGGAVEAALPAALPETVNARWGGWLTGALVGLIALFGMAPAGARTRRTAP